MKEAVPNWFFPGTSREKAREVLKDTPEGTFLVYENVNYFSLAVTVNGSLQAFKVLRDGAGKYFLWVLKFNSINELVDYHRTSSVSRTDTVYLKISVRALQSERKFQSLCQPTVKAMYDFKPQEAGELGFIEGDVIQVLEKTDENWWRGKLNGKEGIFPVPYVQVIEQEV
ncbi:growth factor receptor-bound protein 2 [Elysia marginata]|uniref:Growth factor receptor-bound protein 2 n=1 Tax=Elysia marginata TaxID=1093978 RepID=A0AAV4I277_9GAST|nr:growth factor receptor-bound protein 2 [Elysia marginata]